MNELELARCAYIAALERAGWEDDEFRQFWNASEVYGDGISGVADLDEKMDATDTAAWSALLDAFFCYDGWMRIQ